MFDSLVNRGEYYSNHYLDVLIQNDLAGLRGAWDEAERRGEATARTRLRGLGRAYFAAKTHAAQRAAADPDDVRLLHDSVLTALGFAPDRCSRAFTRGEASIEVPLAAACDIDTGLLLVALDAGLATDVDEVLDDDRHGPGALLSPIGPDRPARERVIASADAVSLLFATEEAPRYALVLAGGIVVLADRNAWGEGRFLAVDIDLALSRNDTKAKGELETIAALFSADALVPKEGPSVADALTAASQKHAVGVSKDLRDGIRLSVEVLANEVIAQRLAANQAVYNVEGLAGDLTKQCLRFLYRLLFLLYAEARPELRIVPKDHPEYDEGYGLDRLRDLALTPLTTDRARDGTHIHESLKLLFRLVNDGHGHAEAAQSLFGTSEGIGLRFEPLRSELFAPKATPLLDAVKLRNDVLQHVLRMLMLSREAKGKARGFVSYANLGINQLGAVYEGLMAYTGFFAIDDLYEVSLPDAADKGTWVIPVTQAGDLPDEVFVTRPHAETGESVRVLHPKGSFVFRLSGRDRQRSASYYTPEILTRCVVHHAITELLDQSDKVTTASRILDLTICEPALGSGAFLNEAITQLAAEYLRRRQTELGESIEPEAYSTELQKVKAHLALHQCYGVDLNSTAVELAEVSLWLNATYPGLRAPWFGLRLRRGNSLIGARRATYTRTQLAKSAWLTTVPTPRGLVDGPIPDGEIHHFLLPAQGWAAIADAKQAKELRPEDAARFKAWRKAVRRSPLERDGRRLVALARRVETLWNQATQRLRLADRDLRRSIQVWGADQGERLMDPLSREHIEEVLRDPNSPLGRLRLVMDAWCALWFWPIEAPNGTSDLPTFAQWLDALEGLLGFQAAEAPPGQFFDPDDLDALVQRDRQWQSEFGMRSVGNVLAEHPWLHEVRRVADREGFWHWELEFAPVFQDGGFNLQVGNPPWVRPTWQDDIALAELDPWFGVTDTPPVERFSDRRAEALASPANRSLYLADVASSAGLNEHLSSTPLHPLLSGIQTNLYMVFMDTALRHLRKGGVVGLLHPESHFVDPAAGVLRQSAYRHLRRHFQFINEGKHLFEDIHNMNTFGIHIYGDARSVRFLQISHLQRPDTADLSLEHDGTGETPTIQFPWGGWDLRPHRDRVLTIDETALSSWAKLFDEPGTPADQARLLRPVTRSDLDALETLADQPARLADHAYHWTRCHEEDGAKRAGIIRWDTQVPASLDDVILQGPHFTVATPFAKQPNDGCKNNKDYSSWDLEGLPAHVIPRTNYQRACNRSRYEAAMDHWEGRPSTAHWRHIHREMTQPGLERSVQGALIPPGPAHIHACLTYGFHDPATLVRFAGLMASLPFDYLFKSAGAGHVAEHQLKRLPLPRSSPFDVPLSLRVLRMNCLTAEYAPLWNDLYDDSWRQDAWTSATSDRTALGNVGPSWTMATPLRMEYERRMALVEIDALASLMLGLTAEQLCAIYRTQFAVLRKYEYAMWFDSVGRKVPPEIVKAWKADPYGADLGRYIEPFSQPDREKEMTQAYEEFHRRIEAG